MTTLDECVDSTDCPPGQTCQLFVDSGARCADDTEAPTEVPAEGASDTTPAFHESEQNGNQTVPSVVGDTTPADGDTLHGQ